MSLDQNPPQTVNRFGCVGALVQCMRVGFLCPKCDNFSCLHIRHKSRRGLVGSVLAY